MAIAPAATNKIIRSMIDTKNPVIANQRGLLNMPIKNKKNPKNHKNQSTPGSHEKHSEISASTNPADPISFDLGADCGMVIVWF